MPWDDEAFDSRQQRGFHLLGKTIRRRRAALGLSQRQLEALSGIDQTVISRLENGKQTGLRWVRVAQLVDALDGLESPRDRQPLSGGTVGLNRAGPIPPARPTRPPVIDLSAPDVDVGPDADPPPFDPNW